MNEVTLGTSQHQSDGVVAVTSGSVDFSGRQSLLLCKVLQIVLSFTSSWMELQRRGVIVGNRLT